MKNVRTIISLVILILLSGVIHSDEEIIINLAFLYKQGTNDIRSVLPDESSTILKPGNEIKIYLRPIKNAYIYLFLLDASENLYLLFPQRISYFDLFYEYNTTYSFPQGNEWARLDNMEGIEEFIVIAASQMLAKLEKLLVSYNNLFNKKERNEGKLAKLRYGVLEEIQRLKHEFSQFRRKAKEKLIKVAVKIRSTDEMEEIPMFEITAKAFYIKTIRIHNHTTTIERKWNER